MPKTAIIVMSDPNTGGEEALGRVFNALVLTLSLKEKGEDVDLSFQGTGTRWPAELVKPAHPANGLYEAVRDRISGVSGGCADLFGAAQGVSDLGLSLTRDRALPRTHGLADLSKYIGAGSTLLVF
ncbi:hypothetical protein [Roseibium sp.]|uniref:hypothetical protein n=1 Tax=Roseibium sp. TaxID=1936156 RepID=UPI003D0CDD79